MTTPPTTPPAEPVKVPDAVQEHIDRLGWMLRSIVDLAESERQTLNFAIDRLSAPAVPAPAHAGVLRERVGRLVETIARDADQLGSLKPQTEDSWKLWDDETDRILALLPAATDGMDARRLDWLDSRKNLLTLIVRSYNGQITDNLRQAIDEAMSADDGRKLPD